MLVLNETKSHVNSSSSSSSISSTNVTFTPDRENRHLISANVNFLRSLGFVVPVHRLTPRRPRT